MEAGSPRQADDGSIRLRSKVQRSLSSNHSIGPGHQHTLLFHLQILLLFRRRGIAVIFATISYDVKEDVRVHFHDSDGEEGRNVNR